MLESGDIVAHWRCLVGSPGRPREGGRQEHHDAAKTRKKTIWLQISKLISQQSKPSHFCETEKSTICVLL